MRSRALSLLFGAALVVPATRSFADDTPEPAPPRVVSVDYASIPTGTFPPLPAEADAPKSAPNARVKGLKLEPVADKGAAKRVRKHPSKKKKPSHAKPPRFVEIRPEAPSLGLLYVPNEGSSEIDGESSQRLACGNAGDAQRVRWERLTFAPDGTACLQIDDVWFDSRSCSLWPGSSAVTTLKPVAWDAGKPWLYAVRGDTSVTFVMPRSNEMSADTMVGSPLTVRGDFTRVTLPVGRWGSGSMLAALPALALEAAPAQADKPPVELSLELVQTMAERYPTLLVRTREAVEPAQFE
jgi:hypothetical protein